MSNPLLINSNGYVQSQNIKVFPCAYRGYYEEPTEGATNPTYKIINPEARTTSEYSFVNSYHKLSATKESYVISWTPSTVGSSNGILKFVIGGYYFEITNCTLEDFITTENDTTVSKTFYINIQNNGNIPGQYLGSFENNARWLDIDTGNENNLEHFYFTGLKISTSDISSDAGVVYSLTPFASQYQHWRSASDSTSLEEALSDINDLTTAEQNLLYYTDEETNNYSAYSDILAPTTASFNGAVMFYKQVFDINPVALPITNLLDSGSGKYSLRVLEDTENGTNNTTIASGDYSIALGKRTEASGLFSTALGNVTKASGEASLATGNMTEATGINAIATGHNTIAQGNSSITTGSYTQTLEDNSFAGGQNTRANGTNSFAFGENTIANGRNAISAGYKAPNTSNVGAYGQNSITAGTDTKTATEAINAIAIGDTTVANSENSFAGGSNSEANTKNSFAFGNNVKTNAENQVVFGAYNEEDADQAFIIANGESNAKSNKFTVSYEGDVVALGNTILGGNATANIVSIKTNPTSDDVNVKITGSAVITNTTTIRGTVGITKDTESNSKTTGALTVAGGVGVDKNLNVGGDTNLNNKLVVKTSPANTETNVKVDGTLKVTGKTDIYSNVTIDSNKTTLAKSVEITDTTPSTSNTTGALKVSGGVGINENLNVNNNVTIGGTTTINDSLTTKGNITSNKADTSGTTTAANNFILGSNAGGSSGTITVYGNTANTKVFEVTNTGNTTATGSINFTNTTDYSATTEGETTTYTAALKVAGGVHIGKKLNVTNNAIIGGTLTVTDSTTLNDNLSVAGDLITTAANKYVKFNSGIPNSNAYLQVNGTAEIAKDLTLRKDLFVTGSLHLNGNSSTFELLDADDNPAVQLATTEATLPGTTITGDLELGGKLTASDATSEHQIGNIKITGGDITDVSALTATGMITANVFNATYVNTSSDRRLKQNIEDYKCDKSILNLPVKKYKYISDPTKTQIGCIAQDLQEICPELVSENENGYLSIQENKLVYLLLQEVKALKERIEELERR